LSIAFWLLSLHYLNSQGLLVDRLFRPPFKVRIEADVGSDSDAAFAKAISSLAVDIHLLTDNDMKCLSLWTPGDDQVTISCLGAPCLELALLTTS
jgi:hypothetical protein